MPFVALPTVVDGTVIQASWGNQVKANFDASPNGLATVAGQLFYATAAGTLVALGPAAGVLHGPTPAWGVVASADLADGAVTPLKLSARYSCRARRTTTLVIGTAATVIGFDADNWDNAGLHDPVSNNNRFVAPAAGVYDFSCSVALFYGTGNGHGVLVCRNSGGGSLARQDMVPFATSPTGFATVAGQVYLSASDWIEFAAFVDGTGTATLQASGGIYPCEAGLTWISAL